MLNELGRFSVEFDYGTVGGHVLSLVANPESIPLVVGDSGVACIGGTRVTLDTLVAAYEQGASPEEIVSRYATLELADVYAIITYYLRHRGEVENYLSRRKAEAEEIRAENERRFPPEGRRERLLARRAQREH